MSPSLRLLSRLPFAAAAAALLTLAACGGGGGGSDASAPNPPPGQGAPVPDPVAPAPNPGPAPAPVISTQPAGVSAASGAQAVFSVAASGAAALTYQWLRNGVPVPGAQQASHTVTAGAGEDGAIYTAVVRNGDTQVRSNGAALRLAGATRPGMIGAYDLLNLQQVWINYYGALAVAPSGELLLNINDGGASVQIATGTGTIPIGRSTECLESTGIAADRSGAIYMACEQAVLRVADNTVTVLAGRPNVSGNADGKGDAARFASLSAIAVGTDGVVYVSDQGNRSIRRIAADGTVSTVGGSVTKPVADGPASVAGFNGVGALALDRDGNLIVGDTGAIRRITFSDNMVRTIAGSLTELGDRDGAALAARFSRVQGLVFDSKGNLFIADEMNHTIRRLGVDGQVSTFAGSTANVDRRDGKAGEAGFAFPTSLAIDAEERLYVIDASKAVRRITPDAQVSTPYTLHDQSSTAGHTDGAAASARFDTPSGLAADLGGNLYVADLNNKSVRRVSPGGVVSTMTRGLEPARDFRGAFLAVSATQDGGAYAIGARAVRIDGSGAVTELPVPTFTDWADNGATRVPYSTRIVEIAADRFGNRYDVIEELSLNPCPGVNGCPDSVRRTLRRTGADGQVRDWRAIDAPQAPAGFSPHSLVTDAAGNLYLSEGWSDAIWKLTPAGAWSLFTGAKQRQGRALAVDSRGTVFALDMAGDVVTIRKIGPDGKVTLLPASGSQRLYPRRGQLPPAIAVDADDRLWVTLGDAVVQVAQP